MSDTCVFTVVHPKSLKYFNSFLRSLENQTKKDFDVCVLCDEIEENVINTYLKNFNFLNITILFGSFGILGNRLYGLKKLYNSHYNKIIFGDSDDMFDKNRVEILFNELEHFSIVVNDLIPFINEKEIIEKGIWTQRLSDGPILKNFLIDKNIIGFGNSALKRDILSFLIDIVDKKVLAPDWYIFSQLPNNGDNIKFTSSTVTYYRQHVDNIIGAKNYSVESLKKIIDVKMTHYEALYMTNSSSYDNIRKFNQKLEDKNWTSFVIEQLNNLTFKLFWWEENIFLKNR